MSSPLMKRKYLYSSIIAFLIVWCGVFAINTVDEWWKIISNTSTKIDVHNVCRVIGNSGSSDLFIPTKTVWEWASFRANKPTEAKEYLWAGQCWSTYIWNDSDCVEWTHQEWSNVNCCLGWHLYSQRSCVWVCSTDDCSENMYDVCNWEPNCLF